MAVNLPLSENLINSPVTNILELTAKKIRLECRHGKLENLSCVCERESKIKQKLGLEKNKLKFPHE